jgi:hypothetical protein
VAVDRGLWWSVWWPWVIVGIVAVLALLTAARAFVTAWRSRRLAAPSPRVPGLTLYLNAKSVMDAYQVGGFGDVIVKEVTDRVGVTKDGKVAFPSGPIDIGGGVSSQREVVKTYVEDFPPIAVVGMLLAALEAADGVMHVDLSDRTIRRNTALERAMPTPGARSAQLRKLRTFASVKGELRHVGDGDGTTVFLAPIGNPDNPPRGRRCAWSARTKGWTHTSPTGRSTPSASVQCSRGTGGSSRSVRSRCSSERSVASRARSRTDRTRVTASDDRTARAWDLTTGATFALPIAGACTPSKAPPRTSTPWRSARTASSWQPASMTEWSGSGTRRPASRCWPISGQQPSVDHLAFGPDGARLARGGPDGTVVWAITPTGSREASGLVEACPHPASP